MYAPHHSVIEPTDPGSVVWRYVDLFQFQDLLDTGTLGFCRVDAFPDRLEGSFPRSSVLERQQYGHSISDPSARAAFEAAMRPGGPLSKFVRDWPRWTAASCWRMSPNESELMWRADPRRLVAIRTTYERLRASFIGQQEVLLGQVRYIDFLAESFNSGEIKVSQFFHKHVVYSEEREIRALIQKVPEQGGLACLSGSGLPRITKVPVELDTLLMEVVASPFAPDDQRITAEDALRCRGRSVPVIASSVNLDPLY